MPKKSLERLNNELNGYKKPKKTNAIYHMECQNCGHAFEFKEEDLPDRVIKCPNCGYEEIFFKCNFE